MTNRHLFVGAGLVGALAVGLAAGVLLFGNDPAATQAGNVTRPTVGESTQTTDTSEATTTTAPTTTTTTAPAVDPAAALHTFAARLPGSITSPVKTFAKTAFAMVAYDDKALALRFDGTAWTPDGSMTLPYSLSMMSGSLIMAQDVTGDGKPDFGIPLGGAHGVGVVASNHSGTWKLVSFGGNAENTSQGDLRFQGRSVMTTDNPCEPDCATSRTYDYTWRYDPALGSFVSDSLAD